MLEIRRTTLASSPIPVFAPAAATAHSLRDVLAYAESHREALRAELDTHGALLLRGFAIEGAHEFADVVRGFAPTLVNYAGGDSPRAAVTDKVYTSTSYPAALPIGLHNEMSYTREYPPLIAFYCEVAPVRDGETPLADCRRVLAALPPDLVERFHARRLRYIQNLHGGAGIGKSWQATFETTDRGAVEAMLQRRGAEYTWRADGGVRVVETIDPVVTHPRTGERVFFCQAHLWHASGLDPKTRAALRKVVKDEDLYHACTFGDGTPIDEADLDTLRAAMAAAATQFAWQPRDLLVVDNLLVAHGRRPFSGPRRILVAMG